MNSFLKFRIKCNIDCLNLARCAGRYKPQCRLALLRQNGLYPLCCLSFMRIIDKKSMAWLTKHVWLLPHICEPIDDDFLFAPRVLHHDSWIILPLLSVLTSLSCALKDQQRFDARLTIGKWSVARYTDSYHGLNLSSESILTFLLFLHK